MKRYARPSWNKTFPEGIPSKFLYPSSPVEPYPIPVPCRCHTPPVPCELSHQELSHGSPPSQTEAIPQSPSSAKSTFLPTVGNPPGYHLLLAVQEKPQIPVGSSPISFSDHALYRGTAIRHIPGEPSFVLTQPGVYQISYSATLSNADGVFPKAANVGLYLSGERVPGSFLEQTFLHAEQTVCISASLAVSVTDAPAHLWLHNGGTGISYNQCALFAYKVCE